MKSSSTPSNPQRVKPLKNASVSLDLHLSSRPRRFHIYPSPLKQGFTYVPWSQPEEWTKVQFLARNKPSLHNHQFWLFISSKACYLPKGSILKVALCARVQTRLTRRRIRWARGTTECISEQELVQATQRLNLPYLTCGATTVVS